MTKPHSLAAALLASLPPSQTTLAFQLIEAIASQPNLPDWLISLREQSPEDRADLLRRAALILRSELPDRHAAAFLWRLAEEPASLVAVLNALPGALKKIAIAEADSDAA